MAKNKPKNFFEPHRWKKGETGNPKGRPRRPEIQELRNALEIAKEKHKKSFLQHFVEKAYEEKDYAIALFKKILPNELFINKEDKKIVINLKGEMPRPIESVEVEVPEEKEEEEE